MARLPIVYAEVEARVDAIRRGRDWPCRAGCAHCCRNLSTPMHVTPTEWTEVERGLAKLPESARRTVRARLDEDTPRVCPFLEPTSDRCLVYVHRPAACRTYGYYVTDGEGTWCDDVERHVRVLDGAPIVFGHHDAVQRSLGEERWTLAEWLARTSAI